MMNFALAIVGWVACLIVAGIIITTIEPGRRP
jgi:hypothetical protein